MAPDGLGDQVRALLDAPAYQACKESWISRSGVRFTKEPDPAIVIDLLIDSVRESGVGVVELRSVLENEQFLAFLEAKARLDGRFAGQLISLI